MRVLAAYAGLPIIVLAALDPAWLALAGTVATAVVTWYVAKSSQRAQAKQATATHQDKVINTALDAAQSMLDNYRVEVSNEREQAQKEREHFEAELKKVEHRLGEANTQVEALNRELDATRRALVDARESEARLRDEMEAMRAEMRAFRSVRESRERTRWNDGEDADGST